jgi:hypothetical protein
VCRERSGEFAAPDFQPAVRRPAHCWLEPYAAIMLHNAVIKGGNLGCTEPSNGAATNC